MPHEIRLAGPWEYSTDDGSTWDRCSLPFDAASQCELTAGTVAFVRRRFHKPSGLEQSSTVSIVVLADGEVAQVMLNGCDIVATVVDRDAEQPVSVTSHFCVSELLKEFNTLQVSLVASTQSQASAIDATRLRIVDA